MTSSEIEFLDLKIDSYFGVPLLYLICHDSGNTDKDQNKIYNIIILCIYYIKTNPISILFSVSLTPLLERLDYNSCHMRIALSHYY